MRGNVDRHIYNSLALFRLPSSCWLTDLIPSPLELYRPVNQPSSQNSVASAPALPRKLLWLAYSPNALPSPRPYPSCRSALRSLSFSFSLVFSLSLRLRWKGSTPRKTRRSLVTVSLEKAGKAVVYSSSRILPASDPSTL